MKFKRVNFGHVKCEKNLPEWPQMVKVNGKSVVALLDTGCSKSIVHLRYLQVSEYLPWRIPYTTDIAKKSWFPALMITLKIEGKKVDLALGVSPHIQVDMLMGHNVPHFHKFLRDVQERELNKKKKTIEVPLEISQIRRVEEHYSQDEE